MHTKDEKDGLREAIKQRLARLSENEKAAESRSVCRRLLEYIPAESTIGVYYAMPSEIDLALFIEESLKRGNQLALPCYEDGVMTYREYATDTELIKGPLNTMDPPSSAAEVDRTTLEYVLVPGRAFDRNGNRMGRGNGGYDIWIAQQRKLNQSTQYVGVAFDCQMTDHIPLEAHDEVMDVVATSREIIEPTT